MSSVTVDFDIYPRQIMSGQTIRCFNKSSFSGISKWYYLFKIAENKVWTASAAPSTHINLSNASTNFEVDQQVMVAGVDLPNGLVEGPPTIYYVKTATTTYLELSLTKGGAAVQYTDAGSGTFTISHAASSFEGGLIKPCPVTSTTNLDVQIHVYDSSVTLNSLAKTALLRIYPAATAVTKPASTSIYGRVSIFIYDSANATAINRMKTTNNNLYFQDLKVSGSMNKAGTATFKVYNSGGATATEKGLMVADKNVAIISGRNVIWTGKILKATQGKMSQFDTASPFMSWTLDCESDISKMKLQPVKAANKGEHKGPVGYILNKLVENSAATDIDWRGVTETSLISFEGPEISYTITDADMYDQFMNLANYNGYDWRTRNNYVKYLYGASGYSSAAKTVTVSAIAPYTTNSFAGRWLLFVNSTNADATANIVGIRAYGNIASNTTTVITLTSITNDTIPPASSDYVIILGDPVLDFASDLRQPNYQATFTMNKARVSTLQNAYEMNDKSDFKQIATKVTAKGKSQFVNPVKSLSGKLSNTEVATLVAKDAWDNNKQFFEGSTFITQKTSAWVYSYTGSATTVILIGHNLAMQNGDWISFNYVRTTGVAGGTSVQINATPTEQTQADGTPTTTVSMGAAPDTVNWMRYSVAMLFILYVDDNTIYTTGVVPINIGTSTVLYATGTGLNGVYGPYLSLGSISAYDDHPHLPGCIVSTQTYTEAAPQTDSPLDLFGLLHKTYAVDQNVSETDLELYATSYLLNHSNYYRKGTCWAFVYDWFKTDLRPTNQVTEAGWITEGGLIAILQNTADTATDLEYAQYKNQWQVLAWTLDGNQMTVTAELGDFERNTNTLINDKTTGINYTIT